MESLPDQSPDAPRGLIRVEIVGDPPDVQRAFERLTEQAGMLQQAGRYLCQLTELARGPQVTNNPRLRQLRISDLKVLGVIKPLRRPGRPRLEDEDWQGWRELAIRIIELRQSGKFTSYAAAARYVGVPPDTFKRWKRRLEQSG